MDKKAKAEIAKIKCSFYATSTSLNEKGLVLAVGQLMEAVIELCDIWKKG